VPVDFFCLALRKQMAAERATFGCSEIKLFSLFFVLCFPRHDGEERACSWMVEDRAIVSAELKTIFA
jgi:hypothetical protein